MSEVPVLTRLLLVGDPRLPFLDLDLRDPKTGDPLPEICLTGPNGSGKSTLLARIAEAVGGRPRWVESEGFALSRFALDGEALYLAHPIGRTGGHLFRTSIESTEIWENLAASAPSFEDFVEGLSGHMLLESVPGFQEVTTFWFDDERSLVNGAETDGFVPFLEGLLREREEAFHRFLREPGNRDKTVAEVEQEFEQRSHHALTHLAEVWNGLLDLSGLRADFARADGPFFSASGAVTIERLGSTLARVLHRTGLAITRSRVDVPSIFFCDGFENGLHPRLADACLSMFRSAGRLFITTHSPLLASRFTPEARLRIETDAEGKPGISRGASGASLKSEFGIEEPVAAPPPPPAPVETRERRSSRIKRAIRESENEDELADLIDEVITFRQD